MIVEFSERAASQIEEVVRFIAVDKPGAARNWAESVRHIVMKLASKNYHRLLFSLFGRFWSINYEILQLF